MELINKINNTTIFTGTFAELQKKYINETLYKITHTLSVDPLDKKAIKLIGLNEEQLYVKKDYLEHFFFLQEQGIVKIIETDTAYYVYVTQKDILQLHEEKIALYSSDIQRQLLLEHDSYLLDVRGNEKKKLWLYKTDLGFILKDSAVAEELQLDVNVVYFSKDSYKGYLKLQKLGIVEVIEHENDYYIHVLNENVIQLITNQLMY